MVCKNYIIKQITILSSPFRLDNNRIMVENYGESIQDRSIPNPVTTFAEAYADYRELSHCIPFFKFDNVMIVLHSVEGLMVTLALLPFQNL